MKNIKSKSSFRRASIFIYLDRRELSLNLHKAISRVYFCTLYIKLFQTVNLYLELDIKSQIFKELEIYSKNSCSCLFLEGVSKTGQSYLFLTTQFSTPAQLYGFQNNESACTKININQRRKSPSNTKIKPRSAGK